MMLMAIQSSQIVELSETSIKKKNLFLMRVFSARTDALVISKTLVQLHLILRYFPHEQHERKVLLIAFFFRSHKPVLIGAPEDSNGGAQHKDRLSDLKIIDNLLKTYDRRATPTNKFGKPTQVGCELFIRSFGSISEKTMVRIKH